MRTTCRLKPYVSVLIFSFLFLRLAAGQELEAVQMYATWTETPTQIAINWVPDGYSTNFEVFRKELGQDSFVKMASLNGTNQVGWVDQSVQPGVRYEYMVHKITGFAPDGYGYVCAGIRAPAIENRGKILLLVEQSLSQPLAFGLARLQQDLTGDGWMVSRFDVSTNTAVTDVKELIRSNYNADPANTKSVLLFGHIPVPYSGYIAPDGHDDHRGAWPADVYYGDMDGQWTDTTVIATNVANPLNRNVPGDGKFDQSEPPGKVRLQIGRVDLSNLTCFANKTPARYEVDLAQQYLVKDHAFRNGQLSVPRRGLIYSRYGGLEEEPQAATGMRMFPGFFGPDQIKRIAPNEFLPELDANAYLWLDIAGSGGPTYVDAVASSDDMATHDPKMVFSAWNGSYFGDWDRESNFLRAALAAGSYSLGTIYCGQPPWFLHTMSLGGTIGEVTQLTQNNKTNGIYLPHRNFGVGQVHLSLMGDPTLRLHPIAPPQNVSGSAATGGVNLQWTISPDRGVIGYYVYTANSAAGPYTRISGADAVTNTQFTDPSGTTNSFYMVRALKLESTPSGTYYNLSQGAFFPDPLSQPAPPTPTEFRVKSIVPGGVILSWNDPSGSATSFILERRTLPNGAFQTVGQFAGFQTTVTDAPTDRALYAYRVKAVNANGESAYTAEAQVNLQTTFAMSVGVNSTLNGKWIGSFGEDGYILYDWTTNLPPTLDLSLSNAMPFIGSLNSTDKRALLKPNGTNAVMTVRSAASPGGKLEVNLRFLDSAVHRVAIYQLGERTGTMQAVDPFTGAVLASISFLGTTNEGDYMIFDVCNSVNLLLSTPSTRAPQLNAIFLSKPTLEPPQFTPAGGEFFGKIDVSMLTLPGATIRYTLDGTTPTTGSPIYFGPILLTTNATIRAQAFANGFPDSGIASASFTNSASGSASFVRVDSTTQGNWTTTYGQDGSMFYGVTPIDPDYVDVMINNGSPYIWSDSTTEMRALNKNNRDSRRMASCWYAADELSVSITLNSEQFHTLAIYFLDWDLQARSEDVDVLDSAGNVLDSRRMDNFTTGKYLVWNVRGSVTIRARRAAGNNVVINGIFLGPTQQVSQQPPHLGLAEISSSGYSLRIEGVAGQTFDIQYTTNLTTWTTIAQKTLTSNSLDWSFSTSDTGNAFYRAVLSSH